MNSKFLETIKKYGLLKKEDKVLVAVSGGPDSVCLLLQLAALRKGWNLSLYIAHMDHMLRPGSGKDAAFVKKLGEKLKIPVHIKPVNLKNRHVKGSLEELAREARHDFLINLARKIKA
ncbi:tRNA(Ile)-lysidine synthetase, partial [bacterium]